MQVFELINTLKILPQEARVYISSDPEGNSYGTISKDSFGLSDNKDFIIIFPELENLNFEDL
jgi:hypothetical protein